MTGTSASARARPRAPARTFLHQAHERGRRVELERYLEHTTLGSRDWKGVIKAVIRLNNALHAHKHKGVSFKTMSERETFYFAFFADLRRETAYRNIEPRTLKACHVEAMADVWEARDLGAGTIANYLSYLRTWCQWTGRPPRTVHDAAYYYGPDSPLARRRQAADEDHSWIAAGLDHQRILGAIARICPYVAVQTEFSRLFAARPKEARCLRPHEAVIPIAEAIADDVPPGLRVSHCLRFDEGTKGGRVRDVPIVTPTQWELVRRAQDMVSPGAHLGRPGYSLKANTAHYYRVLSSLGITRRQAGTSGHGLRHERAAECYEAIAGVPPPVRGGMAPDRDTDRAARQAVAQLLGHNRPQVVSCYLGSPVIAKTARPASGAPADDQQTEHASDAENPKHRPNDAKNGIDGSSSRPVES